MPDGTLLKPDSDFAGDPSVLLINQNLDPATYARVIESSDLIVLPYRASSYQLRVSRVAIEAAIAGKPILYPKGTWIGEVAELAGCGVAIDTETPQALVEALETATGRIAELREKAGAGSAAVKGYYSVGNFRNMLLGLDSTRTKPEHRPEA
jgi:glycosyltransferase involved in cell wall biosynthesis